MRVTQENLESVVARINRATGSPEAAYTLTGKGQHVANVGNYHLSCAYGGVSLHRMASESGGTTDIFGCGHVSKRDLHNRMQAYLRGIESTHRMNLEVQP